jgi:uncharacterized protein involved in type VI secretion and phage assembly
LVRRHRLVVVYGVSRVLDTDGFATEFSCVSADTAAAGYRYPVVPPARWDSHRCNMTVLQSKFTPTCGFATI